MKKRLVRWKVYMDRSRGYMAIIQFIAIIYISLNMFLQKHHMSLPIYIVVGFSGLLLLILLIVGRYDYKWGFFSEENRRHSETNPVLMEMLNDIKEIKDR